jgi:chromosome segregation ATPase
LEKLLSTARDEAVSAKIHAQRETTTVQQQLKDAEYALKDAKDEAGHVQHMHQLAVYEAADVRRQLDSTRQELQQARAQLRGNQEKIRDLESSLSAMDVTIEKQTEHMRREHAEELEQIERQLLSLQESNRDAEAACREVKRLEQALAASDGDNTALRQRLKEDARARAEDELMATRALEEIVLERESEREIEARQRANALAELQAAHDKALQELKRAHAEEMEAMVEERDQARQQAEEKLARLHRTQTELETALAKSHADRESEEMQAQEAINIVAVEMGALRNDCAALEDKLATLRREKVEEARQMLELNMALEDQAHEHELVQGSLKAALKVADDEIEQLKNQYRKLQSDLSTEKALREREQEEAQKELKELARLQLEIKARDDRLESMRNEVANPVSH